MFNFDCICSYLLLGSPIAAILIYIIREYMQGGQFTKETNEKGKVVIVTGCNTGIGKETVRELARRGATVYMACRDMKKCEEARQEIVKQTNNQNIYGRECDLSSFESIHKFVAGFKREQQKLHILINNAGVLSGERSQTKDGFELHLGVNHLGHFLLTHLLLDVLKSSQPSRIVNVSSLAHNNGKINFDDINFEKSYREFDAYSQSKLANVLFTRELAKRLDGTHVTVNALHPGVVNTEIFRNVKILNNVIARMFLKPLLWPFVKTVKSGAQTTIYAALDPSIAKHSGDYFSDCKPKKVGKVATDEKVAKLLWAESEKWTRLVTLKLD